jgi:hypothetical protein
MDEHVDAPEPQEQAISTAPPPVQPPSDPPRITETPCPESNNGGEKIRISEWIMVAATLVIALGTIVSGAAIVLQWREMVGGGKQTGDLIQAAKMSAHSADHNATAATSFAQSAASINKGIADAVAKLEAQNRALETARKSSEANSRAALRATIDDFHQDERAYVQGEPWEVTGKIAAPHPDPGGRGYRFGQKIISAKVRVANFGRTPALAVICDLEVIPIEFLSSADFRKQVSDKAAAFYSSFEKNVNKESPEATIFPGNDRFYSVDALNVSEEMIDKLAASPFFGNSVKGEASGTHTVVAVVIGRTRYKDIFGETQTADICGQVTGFSTNQDGTLTLRTHEFFGGCGLHSNAEYKSKRPKAN